MIELPARIGLSNGRVVVDALVERDGRKLAITTPFDHVLKEEIKCMRGAEWCPETRRWRVTDCRRNWIQLEALQVEDGAYRTPPEFKRFRLPRIHVEPRRRNLRAHQRSMLDHAYTVRCPILAAEQGTGKTLVAVELMERAAAEGFIDWWYVAPLKVVQAVELEFEKWRCGVRPRLVHYDVLWQALEARFRCLACGATLPEHRTWGKEPDLLREGEEIGPVARCGECREVSTHEALFERLPDQPAPHGVVFDESSRLKNGGSRRAKAAQLLADAIRAEHDGFVVLMSGTPAPRDPTDWHSQVEIACPGWLRESSKAHLTRRLAIVEQGEAADGRPFPEVVGWRKDEVERLYRRLKPIVEVHMAKDCLDLPELTKDVVRLPVADDVARAARLIVQNAVNAVGALNRLRQLSDGFQYGGIVACHVCGGVGSDDQGLECAICLGMGHARVEESADNECGTPKDDQLLADLARNEETGRVVVYASYHASVDRVVRRCEDAGWNVLRCDGRGWSLSGPNACDDTADPKNWLKEMDAGEPHSLGLLAFVAHPGSGGLGLNLTAARENIFFSNDFNAESRWQAEKRSHRMGQTRAVRIVDYVHLPTDELVLRNLEKKRALQSVTLGEVLECLP